MILRLLSILADFNNAFVRMVSVRPLISNFSSPFKTKLLEIVPNVQITIAITLFHIFLVLWQVLSTYLSIRFLWFFTLWYAGTAKSTHRLLLCSFFLFLFFFSTLALIFWPGLRWSIRSYLRMSENFARPIRKDGFWFVHIRFGNMDKFQFFWHNFPWITFPTQSSLRHFFAFVSWIRLCD